MHHCLILFFAILSFYSLGQKKAIDRSNYQLLWEVSRADMQGSAFLFGTYHSNDNDVFDFPDALYPALLNADAIVLETDITDFMLDESSIIPDVGYNKSYLLEWMVPARSADKVTYTAYGSDEGRPQFIDMYFKQVADNCKKAFHPLETVEDQLLIGLDNPIDPNAPKNIKRISRDELKQKYLQGNAIDLHKYTRNSTLEYVDLYKDLIVDRNIKMTDGIDTLIHQYKSTFIAIGASHLLGPKGVVPLLREKGYTVKLVESNFTNKETEEQIRLKKCNHYSYVDQRFGATVRFGGKPAIKELGNADRLIQYQELGQGNTYSLSIYNYGIEINLKKHIQGYFFNPKLSTIKLDSVLLDDQTKAYQGLVETENGNTEWVRIFKRGNIQYTLSAKGGYRFMNSNRHLSFFNSFQFIDNEDDGAMTETVTSASQTMRLKFPKNYYTESRSLDFDDVWDVRWINPSNGEIMYAYESFMNDNTISYSNDGFGDYIINRFHIDSIDIESEKHEKGSSFTKTYSARANGNTINGKVRQVGNLVQLVEYIGENETRREEFLNSFDQLYSFPVIENEIEIKNESFVTKGTKKGFSMEVLEDEGTQYIKTKNYTLIDSKKSISYHVLVNDFQPWAFSQKNIKDLLIEQISWPSDEVVKEIDTTFDLGSSLPSMHFQIYYPESENIFKGKATLVGKTIVIANMTYPQKAEEQYKNLSFLDSMKFTANAVIPLHDINVSKLKNEIMINGPLAVEDLILSGHIGDSMLYEILEWPSRFWSNFDSEGIVLATIVHHIDWGKSERDLLTYWQERVSKTNKLFTVSVLISLQRIGNSADYITVVNETKRNKAYDIDFYRILEISKPENDFLIEIWPVFSNLIEDSLAWNTSYMIPELLNEQFFYEYFTSDNFIKAITSDTQPPWAAFRYFEIMHEYGLPKKQFSRMLEEWGKNKNDHKTGSIAAWKTIMGERVSFKVKRLLKKDAAVAISYSKVMAVSETPVYDLLTFEQMIGYIAFDHYKDAYFDKNKSLTYLENKIINVGDENIKFAFYKVVENEKTYFMARALPVDGILPSYGAFGNNTYFVYGSSEYQPNKIEEELVKNILEKK